jgi:protease PrsW
VDEQAASLTAGEPQHLTAWRRVLLTSLLFYIAGLLILIRTGNPNLFPTVVLVGNFMVPVTYVVYFHERRYLSDLSLATTALAFVYGGILGVFAASLLEPLFIRRLTFLSAFMVGAIEEFSKILGVLVIARQRRHDSEMEGLILGAAAGMGFAALESTGYAFTAFLLSRGSLSATVGVTLLRGLLAPVGHGTWTAILASVLFRESGVRYLRINRRVVGAYLTVVILHGLWDGLPGLLASMVSSGTDVFIAQVAIGGTGIYILRERWREAKRRQISPVQA